MKTMKILINKSVYFGRLVLQLCKILLYEFWYGYIKSKYGEKAKQKISLYA